VSHKSAGPLFAVLSGHWGGLGVQDVVGVGSVVNEIGYAGEYQTIVFQPEGERSGTQSPIVEHAGWKSKC